MDEGVRFYGSVLGGELVVRQDRFALFQIAEMRVGIGSVGTSFMTGNAEYPHIAFNAGPDALVEMKHWLDACGVPSSDLWTRQGVEALMFFRDPSGNVIELFCRDGYEGAADLPRARPPLIWRCARPRDHLSTGPSISLAALYRLASSGI